MICLSSSLDYSRLKRRSRTYSEAITLYVSLVKHINKHLIKSERIRTRDNRDNYRYALDNDYIKYHLELYKLKDRTLKNINSSLVDVCGVAVFDIDFVGDTMNDISVVKCSSAHGFFLIFAYSWVKVLMIYRL